MDPTINVADVDVNGAIDYVEHEVYFSTGLADTTSCYEQDEVVNFKVRYLFFIEKSNEATVQEVATVVAMGSYDKEPKGSDRSVVVSVPTALVHVTSLVSMEHGEPHFAIDEVPYEGRIHRKTAVEDHSPTNSTSCYIVVKEN